MKPRQPAISKARLVRCQFLRWGSPGTLDQTRVQNHRLIRSSPSETCNFREMREGAHSLSIYFPDEPKPFSIAVKGFSFSDPDTERSRLP